jgi:hypothetical protein
VVDIGTGKSGMKQILRKGQGIDAGGTVRKEDLVDETGRHNECVTCV